MAEKLPGRNQGGAARLPVDRVFSVPGFGTVVTGTLLGGRIRKGDGLYLYPEGRACRVRGIQVYNRQTDVCEAGQRAALNLSGVEREEGMRARSGRRSPFRAQYRCKAVRTAPFRQRDQKPDAPALLQWNVGTFVQGGPP